MAPASRLSERVSVRLPEPVRAWVVDYALMRGVPVSAIVVAALEEFRELCAVGVPDLPPADGRSAAVGRVRSAGARASSSSGRASAVSRPAAGAPASLADVVLGTGPVQAARPAGRMAIPLVNVVAMRKRLPRPLARRDVAMGLVRVAGVVCRDPDAVVDPGEVEC